MHIKKILTQCIVFLSIFVSVWGASIDPFAMVTIPKSGSFLISKCLEQLQPVKGVWIRKEFGITTWNYFANSELSRDDLSILSQLSCDASYPLAHADLSQHMEWLAQNRNFKLFVGIRDLRDVLVSQVFFQSDFLDKILGPTNIKDRLRFLINNDDVSQSYLFAIHRHAENILRLLHHPNTLLIRFEDLVGPKGGGSESAQFKLIVAMAQHIGLSVSTLEVRAIQDTLFGDTYTFREGKIGSWKKYFDPPLLKLFNRRFGDLQRALGYQ